MSSAALTMVTLTCVLSRTLAFSTRAAAPRVLSRAAGTAAWRGASPGFSAGRPLWLSPRTSAAASRGAAPPLRMMAASLDETSADEKIARLITDHPENNVTPYIANLVGRSLHRKPAHPLGIIKSKIEDYFNTIEGVKFAFEDAQDPLVTKVQCFDDMLIEPDHVSRRPSDTYYVDSERLLRTHTSAHQSELLKAGGEAFLCTGDVYRRDEIDSSHFPAFHQMEGVRLFDEAAVGGAMSREEWLDSPGCKLVADDLKATLEGMIDSIFGPCEKRWVDGYFPFTEGPRRISDCPLEEEKRGKETIESFELEIFYQGDWMEVLGCGVVHSEVLGRCDLPARHGWAFGLGLERLAMVLFGIPDIRLFWTDDNRFHKQFSAGKISTFKSYSKYPPVYKDITFWLPEGYFENDFFEVCRNVAGDLIEQITLIDDFTNPKTNRQSHCYRVTYRSMDRSLENKEIDALQEEIRELSPGKLGVELR